MFGRKSSEIMLEGDGLLDELCENVRKNFSEILSEKSLRVLKVIF